MNGSTLPAASSVARATRGRTVRVALAGCGAVGGELVRLLREAEPAVTARFGIRFELVKVLVRGSGRRRPEGLEPALLTTDPGEFLRAPAQVVVEAIGGVETPARLARAALRRGRRLVTANKALLAAHGPQLVRLAARHRTRLDFEAAVAGGIPVLRALRDQLAVTGIDAVRGVLNGTSNYVLTRMAQGEPFATAVAEAQARGFAEADPARDLDGRDAADKIRILAWLAFGIHPARVPIRVRGLGDEPYRLAADAGAFGGVPRLVAECTRVGGSVLAAVEPVVVRHDSPLGQVHGEDNLVLVQSRWNGSLRLAGPGAGGAPTASALLADLVRPASRLRPCTPTSRTEAAVEAAVDPLHRWLLSCSADGPALARLGAELAAAGLTPERMIRDARRLRVLIAPAPWAAACAALGRLDAAGLRPTLARAEL